MFTQPEYRLLSTLYFQTLRIVPGYVELKSVCTGHCWAIHKISGSPKPVNLYHKHSESDRYYHFQNKCHTIKEAILEIKQHDNYFLSK